MNHPLSCSVLLATILVPGISFAYGEGGDISYQERAMHLLINDVRSNPQDALKNCSSKDCKEGIKCYAEASVPVYWRADLLHAAQVEARLLAEAAGGLNSHYTPCTIVSNIASIFPDSCDGSASCACKEKKVTKDKKVMSFSDRLDLFDTFNEYAGENIALNYESDQMYAPYAHLYQYLHETSDTNQCESDSSNGHRWTICSKNTPYNAVGTGYAIGSNKGNYCVQDYGGTKPKEAPALAAGSHYREGPASKNGTLWFKTKYYAKTPAAKVVLSIGDQCHTLNLTRGTDKNGSYGISDLAPSQCSSYFFEVIDQNGSITRYPTTGSLLYDCDQSYQDKAGQSCICETDQHLYNNTCEADSLENCGSHDNNCAVTIQGWSEGTCSEAKCIVSSCQPNYHVYNEACEEDSIQNCGNHDQSCETLEGWGAGTCEQSICVASECQEGFHLKEGTCIADSASECGPDAVDCSAMEGWANGTCEQSLCMLSECLEGYHLYEGACEQDSVDNCGSHGNACTIEGAAQIECQNAQCIVTECESGKDLADNQCITSTDPDKPGKDDPDKPGEDPDKPGEDPDHSTNPDDDTSSESSIDISSDSDCTAAPITNSHTSPIWILLGLFGFGIARRRKEQ